MSDLETASLELVCLLEMLDAKSWPALNVIHDGEWICRSTPDHPSGRLNSVTALPDDKEKFSEHINRLCFEKGQLVRPLRETPLMPDGLRQCLKKHQWKIVSDIAVYTAEPELDFSIPESFQTVDVSLDDYIPVSCHIHQIERCFWPGFSAILHRADIKQQPLFLQYQGKTVGTIMAVWYEGYVGLMDYCIEAKYRGHGLGKQFFHLVLMKIIDGVKHQRPQKLWLQVDTKNNIACDLYKKSGFKDIYHYLYWRP